MLYVRRKNDYKLILQGKKFGTISTREGTVKITLTGSPIVLEEGNEFRIETSRCTTTDALIGCLVTQKSQSRLLMEFKSFMAGKTVAVGDAVILIESIDADKKTAVIRMRADKPIAIPDGGKIHVTLERIEKERFGEAHAIIGIFINP